MGFKLNIGKDGGGGSTGFSLKQSLNMIKAKGMSSQMIGTDVMKDGYYNTVNESGAGSPSNFNAGLRKASASGKLDDNPKFKAAVDASGKGMPMNDMAYKNDDGGMYKRSCFNLNGEKDEFGTEIPKGFVDDSGSGGVTGTANTRDTTERISEYKKGGKDLKTGDKATQSNVYRDGKKAKLEVVDDGRDRTGRKKAGQTGEVTIEKKKGDITFS